MILDLFAGIGGWHALRAPEQRVAIEWDRDACLTLHALGVPVIRADVAAYPAEVFAGRVEGITASPPCQSFSRAGKRAGLDDPRGQLVFEPLRWARAVRPRWMACEQVPDVLGIWHDLAFELRVLGYRTWTGVLSAERYGVPQTRDRAILLASLDRQPMPPAPTHQEYRPGEPAMAEGPGLFGDGLEPWVSMAEALGWGMTARPALTFAPGTERGGPDIVGGSGARAVLHGERDAGRWSVLHTRCGYDGVEVTRRHDQPAPVLTVKAGGQWAWERPATTLTTDARGCPPPGHHDSARGNSQWAEGSIKLTVPEALALQSFPAGYPVQGTKTAQFRQVGNAIPPLLAKRILEAVR